MSNQTEILTPTIHPNPEYYIERKDEIKRVKDFIEKTDGAVIGLTGVRGAGKTSVMEKIINEYNASYFTLKITSPTGYDEKEFFIMLYKRVCEEVNRRIEEQFNIRKTILEIGNKEVRKYLILFSLITIIPIILLILSLLISPIFGVTIFDSFGSINAPLTMFIVLYLLLVVIGNLMIKFYMKFERAIKYRKLFGLYIVTKDTLETLKYEKTLTYQAEANIGIIKQLTAIFSIGKELKTRSFTLPGLTSEYNNYISDVVDSFGGKVIICIDELDKITDPDEVKKLLRGIKGAIFQKNCYYLISISEDAVRSFKTRISTERDMIESTFDEIINLDRINLVISRGITRKWLGLKKDEELHHNVKRSIDVICVLAGGIPRELLRNLREVKMRYNENILPTKTWEILFIKKLTNFETEVKLASISDDVKTEIYEIINQFKRPDQFSQYIQLRQATEKIYDKLNPGYHYDKKDIKKVKDTLQRVVLELKICVVILEYLKTSVDTNEELLNNLLEAYCMLPYNKKLANKYIDDEITSLEKSKSISKQ
ncbi:MAG: P-loop NTPase fold protein [Promethearchaeota archaeon]